MRLQKHWFWISAASILLALLLLLSPSQIENLFRSPSQTEVSGLFLDVYGRVEKKNTLSTHFRQVTSKEPLDTGDVVVTHQDSKVLMGFQPGFWLLPFSKMEFVKKEDQWIGRLIYGGLRKVETKAAAQPLIDFIYDNQRITENEFSSAQEMIVTPLATVDAESFQEISDKDVNPQSGLERQIYQTLLLHKKFFQSCFIKHYQKTNGQVAGGGETVFDLLIDVSGAIEAATVMKSDIDDKEYIQCLKIVFSRMRFKNFQNKEPIHAIFPLQADLPRD